jgi:hypothetical protein
MIYKSHYDLQLCFEGFLDQCIFNPTSANKILKFVTMVY